MPSELSRNGSPPIAPHSVAAPAPFVERRLGHRRKEDGLAHGELRFLARALDLLALEAPADARLAALLAEVSRVVGATRAALLGEVPERWVAVTLAPDEAPMAGEPLAAWLDARAPRSRAERAAAGPAAIVPLRVPDGAPPSRPATLPTERGWLAVEAVAGLFLGFEFSGGSSAAELPQRLPTGLARHLSAALALATEQAARERELAALRARDAERSRFVSTVAHELRTPLTGLGGYLDLILGGRVTDPEVERDFLERSRGIVVGMSELVGDLLELSRLDAGNLQLEIAAFSIAEAGQRTLDRLLPIAIEREIELAATLPPRLRAATADRRRVEQILTNLLGNALKFTAPGGAVELAGWTDGPVAILAVRDDGEGIAPDERERIFERFYRLTGHQLVTGTGLGLPIARDLSRAMGGDLDVASVPGSGSSFVLALAGPTPCLRETIEEALATAVSTEELLLEERAVRRAIAAAGRTLPPPRADHGRPARPQPALRR